MPLTRDKNGIVEINSIKELSVEQAINCANSGVKSVIIRAYSHPTSKEINSRNSQVAGMYQQQPYDIQTYIAVRNALDELVENIDNNMSEPEKFMTIYKRIGSNIAYDYTAGYPKTDSEREYSKNMIYKSRDLTNGLLEGKCVCAGYADILRSALELVDMEATYIQRPNISCIYRFR